jgi:hypothetical protein
VVFVCAPHRGAPLARARIGAFGAWLIQLPGQVLTGIGSTTLRAATSAAGIKGAFLPNSISGLEPNSPLLLSMNTVPIQSPFHSIIGNRGRWNIPLKESSDGVVPYWSTHLDAALSEKIVPANHTTAFQNPGGNRGDQAHPATPRQDYRSMTAKMRHLFGPRFVSPPQARKTDP